MLAAPRRRDRRSGTAAVETAVVLMFVMVPLMIGVWEVGRLVFCQQVIVNACREGARLASQGRTIDRTGAPREITIGTAGTPNVKDTVYQALVTGGLPGLDKTYVQGRVVFTWLPTAPLATPTEPYDAKKGQRYRIALSVEWDRLRWVNLGIVRPTQVSYQVDWRILKDDDFKVNTTVPQGYE